MFCDFYVFFKEYNLKQTNNMWHYYDQLFFCLPVSYAWKKIFKNKNPWALAGMCTVDGLEPASVYFKG